MAFGRAGFSLIWMSILITVASIIMVSALPGNEAGDYNAKMITDSTKLQRVEEAMRSFMATNLRRPCPADGSAENTANFGKEAGTPGTCYGSSPAAPMGPDTGDAPYNNLCNNGTTGCIVSGTIPTRSLGLDDSFAFDSYGRRFTYVVDMRATANSSCLSLEGVTPANNYTPNGTGDLIIQDIAGNTLDNTMYAYIDHGPSGYGAFPEQGPATAAGRVNSGSTDKWMQINAGVDVAATSPGASTFTYNGTNFTNVRIRNNRTFSTTTSGSLDTGFDDFVYYRNDIKNTCCLGPKCIPIGFRIDSVASNQRFYIAGIGDINGDGIPDIVINAYPYIYVVFGTPTGWPIPPAGLSVGSLNGSNGFAINVANSLDSYPVTDINNDGYADIFFCSYWGPNCYVLFGGPGACQATTAHCPSSAPAKWVSGMVNLASFNGYTGVNGTSGVTINTAGIDGAPSWDSILVGITAVGAIDDSGYKSLIALGTCGAWEGPWTSLCSDSQVGFVLYGMPSGVAGSNTPGTWSGTPTVTVSSFNGTSGFEIHASSATVLGTTGHNMLGQSFDFDNDGYADIAIGAGGATGAPITRYGAIYLIYGRTRANWSAALTGTAPAFLDVGTEVTNSRATEFYNSAHQIDYAYNDTLVGADINGDGIPDLITAPYGSPPIFVFGGTRYPATFDLNTITSSQGFSVLLANYNGLPSWYGYASNVAVADVNGDGKPDLLLSTANQGGGTVDGRANLGDTLVFYQPSGGWSSVLSSNTLSYNSFHWDGTDSFQIYGPEANSGCGYAGPPFVADVRPGDGGKPEIMVSCTTGEPSHSSIYGLYKNKGWPSTIDLNNLN